MTKSSLVLLSFALFLMAAGWPGRAHLHPVIQMNRRAIWESPKELLFPASHVEASSHFYLVHANVNAPNGRLPAAEKIALPVTGAPSNWIALDTSKVTDLNAQLQGPLSVWAVNAQGAVEDRTYIQLNPLLDQMDDYNGDDLGVTFNRAVPVLKLWAPTAASVKLHLYSDPNADDAHADVVVPLQLGANGVWSIEGSPEWNGFYYLYEVQVFQPETGQMDTELVTDPYSKSLSTGGEKSQILNPEDSEWKPEGWDETNGPELASPDDIVIYEAHLRDATIQDLGVPAEARGKFSALTYPTSSFYQWLAKLAKDGVTHIHFLPLTDFASVPETGTITPQIPDGLPPDSTLPQEIVGQNRDQDGYNWGYDPVHYFAPEGSYAVHPEGGARLLEMRRMIQSLHELGLGVVMDFVFNHTYDSGTGKDSIFDKIVPGYYYRLNADGEVENSSCCADTASENKMMQKLMVDAAVYWAKEFKIDGFRFDLMNFHTVANIQAIHQAVPNAYLYGEGWSFGSLYDKAPGQAFTQLNGYGQGVGLYNDRLRDAVRGGTTDSSQKSDQGFVTGLYYDFNQEPANTDTPIDLNDQKQKLLFLSDVIRYGMAGNLRDFNLTDDQGVSVRGGDYVFRGQPVGVAASPSETINYVSSHDGYTLWDSINAKMPFHTPGRNPTSATRNERVRADLLAQAIVAFSQGIPVFNGGAERLRSKSGDVNSYNSGDWFNAWDWSREANGWGRGLPPEWSNGGDWDFWTPRLQDQDLKPDAAHIQFAERYFEALVRVRHSSPLFRLRDLDEIQQHMRFLNAEAGTQQIPGLLVVSLENFRRGSNLVDPHFARIIVAINAANQTVRFQNPSLVAENLHLHPELNADVDPILAQVQVQSASGTLIIPARTTAVLVRDEP